MASAVGSDKHTHTHTQSSQSSLVSRDDATSREPQATRILVAILVSNSSGLQFWFQFWVAHSRLQLELELAQWAPDANFHSTLLGSYPLPSSVDVVEISVGSTRLSRAHSNSNSNADSNADSDSDSDSNSNSNVRPVEQSNQKLRHWTLDIRMSCLCNPRLDQ